MLASHRRRPAAAAAAASRAAVSCVEALETRRLFAGNVTVALDPLTHDLSITGDNKSNSVRIFADNAGRLHIEGLDGTTVSGPTLFEPFDFDAVHVDLGNGSDVLLANTSPPPGQALAVAFGAPIDVSTGNGDDSVTFDGLGFGVTSVMAIDTGNGNDAVSIGGIGFVTLQSLNVNTGNGADTIAFTTGFGGDVRANDIRIDGGNGKDAISGIANLEDPGPGDPIIIDVETIG